MRKNAKPIQQQAALFSTADVIGAPAPMNQPSADYDSCLEQAILEWLDGKGYAPHFDEQGHIVAERPNLDAWLMHGIGKEASTMDTS